MTILKRKRGQVYCVAPWAGGKRTLASGDYSIYGMQMDVAVERKSLADLFGTLGQGRERFERELERLELERLANMQFAAVMVESTWQEVIESPPPHSDLNPKTIVRSVIAWQQRYLNVHWTFAGPRALAEAMTLRILERYWKEAQAEKAK